MLWQYPWWFLRVLLIRTPLCREKRRDDGADADPTGSRLRDNMVAKAQAALGAGPSLLLGAAGSRPCAA
jgi:hypothetical protein